MADTRHPWKYNTEGERIDAKNAAQLRYRQSDKYREAYLKSHLKRTYNITLEDYQALLAIQNYQCAICKIDGDYRSWKDGRQQRIPFCVDHCHNTGQVRGLLCNKCNVAIALLNENINSLTNAINYLMEN